MGLQNNKNGLILDINVLDGLFKFDLDLTGIKNFFKNLTSSSESNEQIA